jgi:hypothetical protein
MSIELVTFLAGLALIAIAVVGGGVEVKEVKIPPLPLVPRIISGIVGCGLLAIFFFQPQLLRLSPPQPPSVPGSKASEEPRFLGSAIKNRLVTVREVKIILRKQGMYSGAMDDDPNDAYFQAVATFQISRNLQSDGYVGPDTYAKLREAWPEYFANR